MMQRYLFVLALLSLLSSPACAGFQEGKDAYDNKNWQQAVLHLRPIAEEGDDRALIVLGNMYSNGFGVTQNYQEALSLYKRAAEKNNTDAMNAIGAIYTSGLGVDVSLNTAMQWFHRTAQQGDQTGAFFYATILYRGNRSTTDDIQPDIYNAYKWFKISAKSGQDLKTRQSAQILSELIAQKKLTPEEVLNADQEATEWKPAEAESLGPLPADPVVKESAPSP